MSTPDEKAAAFDPDSAPAPPVATVADLSSAHLGKTITLSGITGELIGCHSSDVGGPSEITVQESNRPFPTQIPAALDVPCEVLDGDPVDLTDVVDMNDFYAKARELDRVSKAIRANEEANKNLRVLKEKLSDELLGTFAQVGQSSLTFDDRRAYIHPTIVPEFEEKEDGSKYGLKDLVDIFKQLGREDQVTKETVNYQTLQGVLREIRDGVIPMPPEMAKIVRIGERPEVRVGVGRKTKR